MEWQIIVALVIAVPIILLPVVFIWYLNFGGIFTAIKESRAQRAAIGKGVEAKVKVEAK